MTEPTDGAILQRDGRTFAVITRIPAGIVTPEQLQTIAAVGRKDQIPILKITSGQRIVLSGIEPDDMQKIISDLGPIAKPETEPVIA